MNKVAFVQGYMDKSAVDPRGRAFSKDVEHRTKQKADIAGKVIGKGSPAQRVGLTPGQPLTTFDAEKKKAPKPPKMHFTGSLLSKMEP